MIGTALALALAAMAISCLTLFSGFGLGALLMPAFALIFPLPVAVAATAVVHVLNNLFKLYLLRMEVVARLLLSFGLPAVGAAVAGALLLTTLAGMDPLWTWRLGERVAAVTPLKLCLGLLILGFSAMDLVPRLKRFQVDPRWIPLGGLLAGFFGGLSGHQGALRAAFLAPLNLPPARFVATQAAIACMVDAVRLTVYGTAFLAGNLAAIGGEGEWILVAAATAGAFTGAFIGRRLLKKVTLDFVRTLVGVLLALVGAGLATGLL